MRTSVSGRARRTTSLTALVDVVFLLLLFFMLASTFSRFSVIEIGLGGTGSAVAVSPVEPTNRVLLTVDANALLFVNGAAVSVDTLGKVLRGSGEAETQRILLRPTARATAQDIVTALEAARAAAAGDVILVR